MNFQKSLFVSIILFLLFSFSSFSQVKNYKIHKVEKGQSLYAIARLYQVELNAIIMENPEAIDGIKTGQELKIPVVKQKTEIASKPSPYSSSNHLKHKVIKGETIYSICRFYSISQDQLIDLNPFLKEGLKEGYELLIPSLKSEPIQQEKVAVKTEMISNQSKVTESNQQTTRPEIYQVKDGDELNSILINYGMTASEFYDLNPEARQGLRKNQFIKVYPSRVDRSPKIEQKEVQASKFPPIESKPETVNQSSTLSKSEYTIGLMLPFKFSDVISIDPLKLMEEKQNFPEQQSIAIDFFEGINYAIRGINDSTCKFKIELFDISEKDSSKLMGLFQDDKFKSLDLCVGPVYNSMFKLVAEQCKKLTIPIVSPFTQQNKILFENNFASKTTPSNVTLIEAMAEFIIDSVENPKVILINNGKPKEQILNKAFKTRYNEYLKEKNRNKTDTITELKTLTSEALNISANTSNYIVVISEEELYLADLLTRLNKIIPGSASKKTSVIGLKKWTELENIDSEYLNRLHFIFPASYFVDYTKKEIIDATEVYKSNYGTDPGEFYFQGIDIATYYCLQLKKQGRNFQKSLHKNKYTGLIMDFNFFSPSSKTGFDNKSLKLIQYDDYKFSKIH